MKNVKKQIIILLMFPALAYSQTHLYYDIKFSISNYLGVDANVKITASQILEDTLTFRLGNLTANNLIVPSLKISKNCDNYTFHIDTTDCRNNILCIPTNGKKEFSFTLKYSTQAIFSTFCSNFQSALYDCKNYENVIPVPNFPNISIFENISVKKNAFTDAMYPKLSTNDTLVPSDFYLWTFYKNNIVRDTLLWHRTYIEILMFKDTLSSREKQTLQTKYTTFLDTITKRLYTPKILQQNWRIAVFPYCGISSCYYDMLTLDNASSRSTTLYHESLHFLIGNANHEGNPGYVFLNETLNEYLMWRYIKKIDTTVYEQLRSLAKERVENHALPNIPLTDYTQAYGTKESIHIFSYGTLALEYFSQKVGDDVFLNFLENILIHEKNCDYTFFREKLIQQWGEIAYEWIPLIENIPQSFNDIHIKKEDDEN